MNTKRIIALLSALVAWVIIYMYLAPISDFIIDDLIGMEAGAHLTESLRFFIFEVPKVLLLLVLIIFLVGIVRSYFSAEKTRFRWSGKKAADRG